MGNTVCLLKFGEKKYMEAFARGEMYFSNALGFRQIEEKEFIKGQGDKLEGSSLIQAQNMTMIEKDSNNVVLSGIGGSVLVHYESANLLPVYCLFACYEDDCTLSADGNIVFHFSEKIKNCIRSHFPKANSVAIIKKPNEFVDNVKETIGTECVADYVNYFNLYGLDTEKGRAIDLEYFKYMTQDVPPQKVENGMRYVFCADYVYRSLLCKDVYFRDEHEYRFILPNETINKGKVYPVKVNQTISVVSLEELFG